MRSNTTITSWSPDCYPVRGGIGGGWKTGVGTRYKKYARCGTHNGGKWLRNRWHVVRQQSLCFERCLLRRASAPALSVSQLAPESTLPLLSAAKSTQTCSCKHVNDCDVLDRRFTMGDKFSGGTRHRSTCRSLNCQLVAILVHCKNCHCEQSHILHELSPGFRFGSLGVPGGADYLRCA